MLKLVNIRIPRRPWNELVLEHECEANAGKVVTKYKKFIWKGMAGLAEKETQVRNWKVPELITCRLEGYLSPTTTKKKWLS